LKEKPCSPIDRSALPTMIAQLLAALDQESLDIQVRGWMKLAME
jgi:hypothetical protein